MISERIAKVIARAGICSRRDAEQLVFQGRVGVNGVIIQTPAVKVDRHDTVSVDGEIVSLAYPRVRLWLFHKPRGYLTTHRDPQHRPVVFDLLPKTMPRVISVGRLDYHSEGLLLLTNDGDFARYLALPATGWEREYRVRAYGRVERKRLAQLEKGICIDNIIYCAVRVAIRTSSGDNTWFDVTLAEGKNREIRKMFAHIGLAVNRLIRISFGPFQLGRLSVGKLQEVPYSQLHHYVDKARE